MSEINSLPSSPFWSLVHRRGHFVLLTDPVQVQEIFPHKVRDHLTGVDIEVDGITYLEDILSQKSFKTLKEDNKWLIHLFYEAGYYWNKGAKRSQALASLECGKSLNEKQPLAILVDYQEETPFDPSQLSSDDLEIFWEKPSFDDYLNAFERGKEYLKRGDCYQYNLTFPFKGELTRGDLAALVKKLWSRPESVGEFAHLTLLGNDYYITNTPECLFEWKEEGHDYTSLESKPIKGTLRLESSNKKEAKEKWQILEQSAKNESELYMITDLIRNDLNRIDRPIVEVVQKKAPLVVHGLIHSYSHLRIRLDKKIAFFQIVKSLFPGGSITGAPKIRVMEIIEELEAGPRGFYCGSTLMAYDRTLVGTINIRSAKGDLSQGNLTYHAGGGITWDSDPNDEYQEMDNKFLSFNSLLTLSLN
jgi:para-aminobenzoate synthetase component 1